MLRFTTIIALVLLLGACSPETMQRGQNRKMKRQADRYTRQIEKYGEDPDLLRNRAYYYGQTGDWEKAVADLSSAAILDPDDSTLLYNLSVASLHNGDTASAQAAAIECVELYPQMSSAWILLGQIYLLEHSQTEALACFNEALELEPHNSSAQAGRGVSLFNLGRGADAAPIFIYLTEKDSTAGLFWLYRGMLAGSGYDSYPVEKALEKALTYDPSLSHARTRLALKKFQQDSISEALDLLRETARLDSSMTILDIE